MGFAGLMIGGSAVSALSQAAAARQQASAMKAQSEYNSKVYGMQAEQERAAAQFNAKAHMRDVQKTLAAQRARFAASGIDVSAGGTPLEVQKLSRAEGEIDRQAILYQGDVAAIRAENQAKLEKWQTRLGARQTLIGGLMGAGQTALTGAANVGILRLSRR